MRPPSITTSYGGPTGTGAVPPGAGAGRHAATNTASAAPGSSRRTRPVIRILLPGAVFTHVGNHAPEPVGGIAPVGLDGALGCVRVSRIDRPRSEEHTSELQSHHDLVCRLLLEKKKNT